MNLEEINKLFEEIAYFTAWNEYQGVHKRLIRHELHTDEKYPTPYVYKADGECAITLFDASAFMSAMYIIDVTDEVLTTFETVQSIQSFLDHHILVRRDSPEKTVPPPSAGLTDMLNLQTAARCNWLLIPNPYEYGESDVKWNPIWAAHKLLSDKWDEPTESE